MNGGSFCTTAAVPHGVVPAISIDMSLDPISYCTGHVMQHVRSHPATKSAFRLLWHKISEYLFVAIFKKILWFSDLCCKLLSF
jgi:hypothetical protein